MDFEERYRIIQSRDRRFDGQFITAVRSTGIYCRPSCPARTPKAANVTFYETSAAAHEAGYRACKRCLPEAVPGTPAWNLRDDVAARAMRLIADGVVEREGVEGLSARLGYSARHLNRVLGTELGAGPLALSRAHRAQTARTLLTSTTLSMSDIAFAAGFSSIRQFNDTVAEVFQLTPTEIRARQSGQHGAVPGALTLALPYREPFDAAGVFAWLAARAIPGIETVGPDNYTRSLLLPGGPAWFTVRYASDPARRDGSRHAQGRLVLEAHLTALGDLPVLVARVRRLFDLDADPVAVDEALLAAALALPASSAPASALPAPPVPASALQASSVPASALPASSVSDSALPASSVPASALSAPLVPASALSAPLVSASALSAPPVPASALPAPPVLASSVPVSPAGEPPVLRRVAPENGRADAEDLSVAGAHAGGAALAERVRAVPGIRMPGAVDAHEMLFRAILGQQITVAAARTLLHRLAVAAGSPLESDGGPTLLFPTAAQIAEHAEGVLTGPRAKIATVVRVAEALASGELTLSHADDSAEQRRRLTAFPGIGEWTASYVAMRVLGNTDMLPTGDVALRTGTRILGLPHTPRALADWSASFAPWRTYLSLHLWRAASPPARAASDASHTTAAPSKENS
ncbi:Ada metal-binding domain-containing protein [Herbiconiux sp. 11R-BC]|uniref:Ada metal-binding domain-containing protein n=1 Tax=Herbiconiux sp. 11R-BC TaxID=3111637 RepID=UPI003C10FD93